MSLDKFFSPGVKPGTKSKKSKKSPKKNKNMPEESPPKKQAFLVKKDPLKQYENLLVFCYVDQQIIKMKECYSGCLKNMGKLCLVHSGKIGKQDKQEDVFIPEYPFVI